MKHVMNMTKMYREFKTEDKEIHEKNKMFRRFDGQHWNEAKLLLGAILFSGVKLAGVLFGVISCFITLKIVLREKNVNDPKVVNDPEVRKKIEKICKTCAQIVILSLGVIVTERKVDYDYSEYLGKDYEKDKMPASYISNHTSWLDILLMMAKICPGFISRIEVKKYPLVGYIATCLGCIFVDRGDKQNRGNALNLVMEKQKKIVSGEDTSKLLIFPEGSTSNATGILSFKQGAFVNSFPLKPLVFKFDPVNRISLALDTIDMLFHIYLILCTPLHYIDLIYLPTFCPNEYLYTKSKLAAAPVEKGKEWTIYANALREIMCDASGLQKIDANFEMKMDYLNFLRKKKI